MTPWVEIATVAGGLITAIGGAQGLRALIRRRPRPSRADAAVALSAGTIRWAERLEATADRAVARADAAEIKADEADRRADAATRQAMRVETQMDVVVGYLDTLLEAIYDDDPDRTPEQHLARIRSVAARRPVFQRSEERT